MRGYSLTSGDLIRATTGQWDSFAAENAGQGALSSAIIGRNLFDMVTGAATCRFLEKTFYNCRSTQTAIGLLYRCDSPAVERLFLMRVNPLPAGGIEVQHNLIRTRPVRLLSLRELGHLRYRRCSVCAVSGPLILLLRPACQPLACPCELVGESRTRSF